MEEQYNNAPQEVKDIIDRYEDMDGSYSECARLQDDLEFVGWTISYYLDAIPYDLVEMERIEF